MYLTIRHRNDQSKELRFRTGPIYIGRQLGSQVFLPDKTISRQHAVIYGTKDGKWVLEDLDSANKTYLNGKAIHKAIIKDGDEFQISDFSIQVQFRSISSMPAAINMEDTLITSTSEMNTIVRRIEGIGHGSFRLRSSRIKEFSYAVCEICKVKNREELVETIISVIKKQFRIHHVWVGLFDTDGDKIEYQKGRSTSGSSVSFANLVIGQEVARIKERKEFELIPRVKIDPNTEKIRSVILAPLLFNSKCLGVIYIANTLHQEAYSIEELNYIMLLSINFGAALGKLYP